MKKLHSNSIPIILSIILNTTLATSAHCSVVAYRSSTAPTYQLDTNGKIQLTTISKWGCRTTPLAGSLSCPANVTALQNKPNGSYPVTLPIYLVYELSNDLRINGKTSGAIHVGNLALNACIIAPANQILLHRTNSCPTPNATIATTFPVFLNTVNTEGIHTGSIRYQLFGGDSQEILQNIGDTINTSNIIYRVKDDKPIPPDTPVSCTNITSSLHFDHGTVPHTSTSAWEKTTHLRVKCDGNLSAVITAKGGTSNSGARVAMTNNGTAALNIQGEDGTWAGVKTISFKTGENSVPIHSHIIHAPGGNTYTGSTIISINYQ
ncbi:hypothetical protein ABPE25_004382 [Salmonella enterica subsp. enterica serovar Newport]|nr:hypothetical protein [Salmonella enterica subsp. enterica serovar Newport]EAP1716809.1 hypothetical protein [Salmonella enterica]EDV5411226.1 hypothetical protein [Salmonella enterica subsp. enterica]EHK8785536.1 hypothetical protein [Salmonella enterica subsp. enterica serovar Bardo]EAB8441488.1 hypothetical protein [Salmonella enterica subsp. enterica serovar Newport]